MIMDTTKLYRKALLQTFASEDYNESQCEAFIRDYDKLVKTGMSGESATAIVYSAWGASSAEKVCRTLKDLIEKQLSEYNSTHKGIDRNPVTRLREYAKRLNDKISQVCITIDGQELSKAELDRMKIKLPGCLNPPTTYSATASAKGKPAVFELDVSE